ncbi:hypothetical protein C9890_0282 [Perkinsus sp. BL_2016]|nr:hypothetical protein C9890_0282 [Perkinsus sp. BL_2016]
MVRFKNRYFLIELVPFYLDQESQYSATDDKRYPSVSAEESLKLSLPAFDVLPSFSAASVSSCIRNSVTLNYGQYANSSLLQSLSVKYSNTATNMVILRVPRDFSPQTWAALTFLTDWPSENPSSAKGLKCTWRSIHCAGTIRSCQKAAISFARKVIAEMKGHSSATKEFLEPLAKRIKTIDP